MMDQILSDMKRMVEEEKGKRKRVEDTLRSMGGVVEEDQGKGKRLRTG